MMFKYWPQVSFCAAAALLFTVSLHAPKFLADEANTFLKDFLDNDILSVLGFITALANASVVSVYLHLNQLHDEVAFKGTRVRRGLKNSALSLIVVFLIAFVVVVVKPIVPTDQRILAALNVVGILCVIFALSVLRDILITVTKIPSKRSIIEIQKENRDRLKNEPR